MHLWKIYDRYYLDDILEMLNVWCRSPSEWLTVNDPKFAIFVGSFPRQRKWRRLANHVILIIDRCG